MSLKFTEKHIFATVKNDRNFYFTLHQEMMKVMVIIIFTLSQVLVYIMNLTMNLKLQMLVLTK